MPLERSNIVMLLGSRGAVRSNENPLKMIVKMLTHIHIVVYTWWCWHIYKGEVVGVDVDQLLEGGKIFQCSLETRLSLGMENCFDPLCFGSNIQLGCVSL